MFRVFIYYAFPNSPKANNTTTSISRCTYSWINSMKIYFGDIIMGFARLNAGVCVNQVRRIVSKSSAILCLQTAKPLFPLLSLRSAVTKITRSLFANIDSFTRRTNSQRVFHCSLRYTY